MVSIVDDYDFILVQVTTDGEVTSKMFEPSTIQSGELITEIINTTPTVNSIIAKDSTNYTFTISSGTATAKFIGIKMTPLGAEKVAFNGSGTNYLTAETEVDGAVKELDTQVKVLNDTTAKLAVSNVFTQPQQVPNATLAQHAVNKLQVETMFEMFKQQLRGYNFGGVDLSGATDLGGGNYRLYNNNGITIDYNVSSGIYTLNGTAITAFNYFIFNIEPNTEYTLSYIYVSGTLTGGYLAFIATNPYLLMISRNEINYNENIENTFNTTTQNEFRFDIRTGRTFDNYQFKLQLEKGSQATPYTVPGQIPQYKIVGEE